METIGIILGIVGSVIAITGTVLLIRIPDTLATNQDYALHDLGGGKAVGLYISAVKWPTVLVVVGISIQLVGSIITAVAT